MMLKTSAAPEPPEEIRAGTFDNTQICHENGTTHHPTPARALAQHMIDDLTTAAQ